VYLTTNLSFLLQNQVMSEKPLQTPK
jgi:hypothetical protein